VVVSTVSVIGGDHRRTIGIDLFEVATAVAGNRGLHLAAVNVRRVRWGREVDRAGGGAGSNVDHCAVGQGDGHRRTGRIAQGRGVRDLATFADRIAGAEGQRGLVDGVVDGGADRRFADVEFLEIAAAGVGHGHGELADVFVNVVAGAAIVTEPLVLPASMVMVWPLLRLTVTGVCAALVKVAV
jgi:hypothetical protein